MTWHGDKASFHLLRSRWARIGLTVGLVALGTVSALGARTLAANASAPSDSPVPYNAAHSAPVPANAQLIGQHSSNAQMQVELVLHPQHESELYSLIQQINTPGNHLYQHWLTPTQFNATFAPRTFDTSWLTSKGLRQLPGPSPLVLVFTGTSKQFEAAFRTTINDYRTHDGHKVYANSTPAMVPDTQASEVAGVIGLDNVLVGKEHPELAKPSAALGVKPKYGAGPGGNGLVPSQIEGIYGANSIYQSTRGQGVTLAVYELSGYLQSDIRQYETQFGLPQVKLQDINIDGGSCPVAAANGLPCNYGGIEDELDINLQQAMAPGISKIQVYMGPNSDQGVLDTYFAIANQNTADAVSTSWGQCESSLSSGQTYGEFLAFAQMALQGQSISSAAGDSGAYDCEHDFTAPPYPPYLTTREVDDPSNNPLITAVGGTSFLFTYDPGADLNPTYPTGAEYVWNTLNNCSTSDFTFQGNDLGLCPFGAAGGGVSMLWAKAPWQFGPGVTSKDSAYGASCDQHGHAQCREVPDVSLNADPNSGYTLFCSDPGAGCPAASDPAAWQQWGGTSCSAPLWAGVTALADSYGHHRVGLTSLGLYVLNSGAGYQSALHDMSGGATYSFGGQTYFTNSNGVGTPAGFPETKGYDMATGVGTPNVSAMAKALAFLI